MNATPLLAAQRGFLLPDPTRRRRIDVAEALAVILVLCVWSTFYVVVCPADLMRPAHVVRATS